MVDGHHPPPTGAVVFSDVDGTLVDFTTYEPEPPVIRALAELGARGVTVVPVTSKPGGEILVLRRRLGLEGPAVVEGGGALIEPGGAIRALGPPREELIAVLRALQADGLPIRGLSQMDAGELSARSGLPPSIAAHALKRSASEPFLLDEGADVGEPDLRRSVEAQGYQLVRGGRLWHIVGLGMDKGFAVETLRRDYPRWCGGTSAAVGDAWNDLAMMALVDHPFLLGNKVDDRDVGFPVTRISSDGPVGFAEAASQFLKRCAAGG